MMFGVDDGHNLPNSRASYVNIDTLTIVLTLL